MRKKYVFFFFFINYWQKKTQNKIKKLLKIIKITKYSNIIKLFRFEYSKKMNNKQDDIYY